MGYDYTSPGEYFITICTHQRDCLFGEIVDGETRLNELGNVVRSRWITLPHYHKHVALDAFVVMPNHIHSILILTNNLSQNPTNRGGAAFGAGLSHTTNDKLPNATPNPALLISPIGSGQSIVESELGESEPGVAFDSNHLGDCQKPMPNAAPLHKSEPGVAFDDNPRGDCRELSPNAAPLQAGSLGAIGLNFKSVTTHRINQICHTPGTPVWQRNYYEHIVRSEASLHRIRQYIYHNPLSWHQDQLHPDHPSKW